MRKPLDLLDKSVPAWKLIVLLAWPSIVDQLMQTAVNYVDTAMVGSIGTYATAAISVCTTTIWLLLGIMNAAGTGYSVLVARRIGEGRREEARTVIRQAVFAALVLGAAIVLAVELVLAPYLPVWMHAEPDVLPHAVMYFRIVGASYLCNTALIMFSAILRCMGDTRTPMRFNIFTNLINVVGNFLLIYPSREIEVFGTRISVWGAGWGVAGAALATAIATTFSAVALGLVLFCRKSEFQIHLGESFRPDLSVIRGALHLGVPYLMERTTICMGQIVSTAMISGLGTAALAANQLANTGESLCYLPIYGFSIAATTIVAQNLGAGDKARADKQGNTCMWMAVGVMVLTSTLMFTLSVPIIDMFSNDPSVISLGALMLRIEAFAEPFFAVSIVTAGVLRGAGDTRWPFYISLAGMWLIRVPVAYLLIHVFHWGLTAIWTAMAIDLVARGIISFHRLRRKKWLNAWQEVR